MIKIFDRFLGDQDTATLVALYGAGMLAGYWTLHYAWQRYRQSQNKGRGEKPVDSQCSSKDVPQEAEILSLTMSGVKRGLDQGRFTSVDLVRVFGECSIDPALWLFEEEYFAKCLVEARRMDEERKTLKPLPPLHGIPRFVKKLVKIKSANLT